MANQLKHVGVLGMKWGIRRNRPDTSSEDHKISRELKKKRPNELSNDEIKKLTTRLQLEKQLKDLTAGERDRGRKILSAVLNGPLGKAIMKAVVRKYVPSNMADIFEGGSPNDRKKRGNVVDSVFVD